MCHFGPDSYVLLMCKIKGDAKNWQPITTVCQWFTEVSHVWFMCRLTQPRQRVQLVDQMLEAKKQLAAARSEGDKNFYESKCATLDRQIDQLVYELYDLTPEEIAIVEGSGQ